MKEGSEQHLVIKAQVSNPVQKAPKAFHNGNGPPQDSQVQCINQSNGKNRGRRRTRGVKKIAQCDELSYLRLPEKSGCRVSNAFFDNEGPLCDSEMSAHSSSKSLKFPSRLGFGQEGTRVIVKANHVFTELLDKDLFHYDVNITLEVTSKNVNRSVIAELVRLYRESDLQMWLPAYDGKRILYTAGELPFSYRELSIKLLDEDDGTNGPRSIQNYCMNSRVLLRKTMGRKSSSSLKTLLTTMHLNCLQNMALPILCL